MGVDDIDYFLEGSYGAMDKKGVIKDEFLTILNRRIKGQKYILMEDLC
jgi:hypothetical protein